MRLSRAIRRASIRRRRSRTTTRMATRARRAEGASKTAPHMSLRVDKKYGGAYHPRDAMAHSARGIPMARIWHVYGTFAARNPDKQLRYLKIRDSPERDTWRRRGETG